MQCGQSSTESDSSMNQDKDLKVEVRRGKEKKVQAPF